METSFQLKKIKNSPLSYFLPFSFFLFWLGFLLHLCRRQELRELRLLQKEEQRAQQQLSNKLQQQKEHIYRRFEQETTVSQFIFSFKGGQSDFQIILYMTCSTAIMYHIHMYIYCFIYSWLSTLLCSFQVTKTRRDWKCCWPCGLFWISCGQGELKLRHLEMMQFPLLVRVPPLCRTKKINPSFYFSPLRFLVHSIFCYSNWLQIICFLLTQACTYAHCMQMITWYAF